MKYVIVYWSRYGHGKKLVTYLAEKLNDKKIETQIFRTEEVDPTSMPEADLYVFSAPAEAFSLQRTFKGFLKRLEGMDNKKYGIINTHGMDKNRLDQMEKILSKKNMIKVAGVDFKVGKDIKSGNAFLEDYKPKIEEFAKKL
jgi:menaquinone-dependent protoporphyrinogen IX oxidase